MVPPDSALTVCPRGVLLVLARLAVDGSEPFGGSELHPPRFLRLVAHATRKEAACIGRLCRDPVLLSFFCLLGPPHSAPSDDRFGSESGNLHLDIPIFAIQTSANLVLARLDSFRIAADLLPDDADNDVLLFFQGCFYMGRDPRLMPIYPQLCQPAESGIVVHGKHFRLLILRLMPCYMPDDSLEPREFGI